MTNQPEALRLAEILERPGYGYHSTPAECAAELRRLYTLNQELLEALEEVFVIGDRLVSDVYGYEFVEKARAAIAKAEGEKQ